MSDWNRHIDTRKHKVRENGTKIELNEKIHKKIDKNIKCNYCDKPYKTLSGLWKHRNKCESMDESDNSEGIVIDKNTILSILKQNSELQQLLVEQTKMIVDLSNYKQYK